jgi:pyruvate formate lyase activating enzyme
VEKEGYEKVGDEEEVLEKKDLLMIDLKSINPVIYRELTGVRLAHTLSTLDLSRRMNVPVWIRHVLVPSITDNEGDLRRMAGYLRNFANIEKIEVLPYHNMGEFKWKDLGLEYELKGIEPPTAESLRLARQILGG